VELYEAGKYSTAIPVAERAAVLLEKTLGPDHVAVASVLGNLGLMYALMGDYTRAARSYKRALAIREKADHEDAMGMSTLLNNLAVVLNSQGRLEEAVAVYRHLLEVDPDYADGHWNLSVALLALGAYSEGWREFEWRFRKANPVPSRPFSQPLWDGSELAGRTILLHAEQGFGDTIQFVRYAPLVAQRGGNVIIECQVHALKRLLHSLEGVAEIVVAGEPLPHFDCHLPLMSLPLVFGTTVETIPNQVPYLAAEPADVEAWQQRLGPATAFRVGLVWFAKQSQVLNRKRSCRLEMFAPLWAVPGVEFFSLQIGLGAEQLAECGAAPLIKDLTSHIADFADTAGFIANLDLVITIDTAVAHLAGALGARTWVLLPYVAEWRWLCQRQDTPWYPTIRLFRQPHANDWPGLMTSVAEVLNECVQAEQNMTGSLSVVTGLRVGLAWSGRQDNPLNRKRSCPFATLAPLLDLPGITFFSLQMDCPDIMDARLVDLTHEIKDFEDTAALMANLDLIISIDTSVAHLAAAVGRPAWVLLSHVADWRWLKNRTDSPWYPAIELFRQPDHGDWEGVVGEVMGRLEQLTGKRLREPQLKRQASGSPPSHERLLLEQLLEDKQQAVRRNVVSPDAHLDVGATLALLGRDNEAAASFRRVLELDPEHVAGHLNLAYALLALGEYPEGLCHFEWRLRRIPPGQIPPWPMLQPNTFGTHRAGSTLLVHCEQGYGDTIQFARFLPMLADAGYRVIVSCQTPIAPLVASISGVSQVVVHGEPLPVCDLQVLLLSLPYLFSTTLETLPTFIPYLIPHSRLIDGWRTRLNKFFMLNRKKD
ncbi:MAG: tetratricopeptide repeat protein, partial [Pseudomonadota bacterium]